MDLLAFTLPISSNIVLNLWSGLWSIYGIMFLKLKMAHTEFNIEFFAACILLLSHKTPAFHCAESTNT